MGWRQDVAPNLNDQSLVVFFGTIGVGNPLADWYGDCAAVVRNAFGIANPVGSSAWQIYTKYNQVNHADRNWPIGMYFPIWFSGYGGQGHVAIAYWNGSSLQIWTSPYTHKAYFDHYTDVDRLASGYGVTYAGWSEDFAGTRLIDYVPDAPVHPYSVENIDPKVMVAPNGATEWNLDDTDWSQFNTNPVGRLAAGETVTVNAIAHHNLGGSYYMLDPNSPYGFNTADITDYTPPVVTPPADPTPPPADTTPTEPTTPPSTEGTPVGPPDDPQTGNAPVPDPIPVVSTPAKRSWLVRLLIKLFPAIFH